MKKFIFIIFNIAMFAHAAEEKPLEIRKPPLPPLPTLHTAVQNNQKGLTLLLLKRSTTDPNELDGIGQTALFYAKTPEMIEPFYRFNGNLEAVSGRTGKSLLETMELAGKFDIAAEIKRCIAKKQCTLTPEQARKRLKIQAATESTRSKAAAKAPKKITNCYICLEPFEDEKEAIKDSLGFVHSECLKQFKSKQEEAREEALDDDMRFALALQAELFEELSGEEDTQSDDEL